MLSLNIFKRIGFALILSATLMVPHIASAEGFAGLLNGKKRLAPITLSSGKPLAEKPYELLSGKYYSIDIVADGSAEIALEGPSFFRNMWIIFQRCWLAHIN